MAWLPLYPPRLEPRYLRHPFPSQGSQSLPHSGQEGPSLAGQREHSENRITSALVTVPAIDDVLIFSHHVILQYFPGSA